MKKIARAFLCASMAAVFTLTGCKSSSETSIENSEILSASVTDEVISSESELSETTERANTAQTDPEENESAAATSNAPETAELTESTTAVYSETTAGKTSAEIKTENVITDVQTAASQAAITTAVHTTSHETSITQKAEPETETAAHPNDTAAKTEAPAVTQTSVQKLSVEKDGSYTTPEDVAEYIHTFGTLPKNFITKAEARELVWDNKKGNLWDVAEGKSIGGDYFGNYEELLPKSEGREYTECDVNYSGGYRGSERIVFSNDGLIYYTNDHYQTFTQLY